MLNTTQIKKKFQKIQKDIKKEFSNENFYNIYVLNAQISKIIDNSIYIIVDNDFVKEVFKEEYKNIFEEYFSIETSTNYEVEFITKEEKDILKINNQKENEPKTLKKVNSSLDERFTFDNFTIGLFNKDAFKAASFFFEEHNNWRTLLIYGSTGLGKTHLLHAIGNKFKTIFPEKNILYIQTEDFLEKIYNALSEGSKKIEEFKNNFDDVDLLLVDDIQFLNNKEKLNEIFFNIFNKITSNNKYIVMTSDKLPSTLRIDDRMISRFNSGLSIRINKPDTDSVKKIIIEKIKKSKIRNSFSPMAIEYIALRFNSDIRTLEGVLNKIYFHLLDNVNIDEVINEQKIKEIIEADADYEIITNLAQINPEIIIESICLGYGVDKKNIISKKRNKQFSFIRKICMFVLREKLNLSYNEIGSFFSNRNHATVLESIKDVENKKKDDKNLEIFLENIISRF